MIRWFSVISVALLGLVSFELYNGVHRVKAQAEQLRLLKVDIKKEGEAIRVLKAEWSYLNQPDRLQDLSRRHLALAPTGASQIVVPTSLPIKDGAASAFSPVVEAKDLPARVNRNIPLPRPKPAMGETP